MIPPSRSFSPRLGALIGALALVLLAVAAGLLGSGPLADLAAAGAAPGSPRITVMSAAPLASPVPVATPSPTPLPSPTPAPSPTPIPPVAVVPVTGFRSTATGTDAAEVTAVLAGTSKRYAALEVVTADLPAIMAALGVVAPVDPARLISAADAGALRTDLAAHPDRLGMLRASQVDPSVRALGWEGARLFGVGRLGELAQWPLQARIVTGAGGTAEAPAYDPASAWTLFAGGDVFLDRGVYLTLSVNKKGADFAYDGGSVVITGHTCCSQFGWTLPVTQRTGDDGALRALISGADLAIANFENSAPVKFTWHQDGTVFSGDPALISGLKNAGLDWVGLANNHMGDAGAQGIRETLAALDALGIAHGGAGTGYDAAHAPSLLTARGVKVAILAYDTIAPYYWAKTATAVGSAQMTAAALTADVAAARAAGAQVVIVFPHWGTEYTTTRSADQVTLGHAAIDAGADMVIGNHPHWAGAVELYKGRPIWHALGNFVFDQIWSEPTLEGITLELTFNGASLVQAVMRPHLILERTQPNFMDPAGSGKVVMDQVFKASKGLLPW